MNATERAALASPDNALRDELIKLWATVAPVMAGKFARHAPSHVDREDLQSEAIAALLQNVPGMMAHTNSIRDMRKYGYGVMRNAMRGEVRKLYREKAVVPIDHEPVSHENNEAQLIDGERRERAELALVEMPSQAAILRARCGDGDRGRLNGSTYRREQRALDQVRKRVAA
jgi:DNA-directed RNA polymerase specialized sigma24 family protein